MKLLYCTDCGDVFNLQRVVKTCSCGKVYGRYVNKEEAVVSGDGISLAIGNGTLNAAAMAVLTDSVEGDFRANGLDIWQNHPGRLLCWARPHEGPANPHTRVSKELT